MKIIKKSKNKGEKKNNNMINDVNDNTESTLYTSNGVKCLSKCYPKQVKYFHPILLNIIGNNIYDTCAIFPTFDKNSGSENYGDPSAWQGKCDIDDNKTKILPNEREILLRGEYFDPYSFLKHIYNIETFEDTIEWTMNNDYLPFDTIKRVHNISWKAFKNEINSPSSLVIEYYYVLATKYWVNNYVEYIMDEYTFQIDDGPDSETSPSKIIKNMILKILTAKNFDIIVDKYIQEYSSKWNLIKSHYDNLKLFTILEIIELLNDEQTK